MEKIKLNVMAKEYHMNKAAKARERAATLVEGEIIPLLESAAKAGQYVCKVRIKQKDVFISDVQNEIAKRVQCRFRGRGKSFSVIW